MKLLIVKFWIWYIRLVKKNLIPDYWKCCNCGHTEFKEKEVYCWKCKLPYEMIYKGE